jgi:flagellar motor switch protein FliN
LLNVKKKSNEKLEKVEQEALTEVLNIAVGSSRNKLSELAGQELSISPPKVAVLTKEELLPQLPEGMLGIQELLNPTSGTSALIIFQGQENIATAEWFNTLNDSMNQSLSTVLSTTFDFAMTSIQESYDVNYLLQQLKAEAYIIASYAIKGEGVENHSITYVMPTYLAKAILSPLLNEPSKQETAASDENSTKTAGPTVKAAQFSEFETTSNDATSGNGNLKMLMDIPLKVTFELGRTKRLVKDILELTQGSIIELDKVAGDPVDILVNDKLIAKGEVVVIDENFGVRITEILSTYDRISKLT